MLPEFETDRLFLREVRLSDSESYQKNFADYEVIRHLSHMVPWPYPEDGVYGFLKDLIIPQQGVFKMVSVNLGDETLPSIR